jgi:hypothetical protein
VIDFWTGNLFTLSNTSFRKGAALQRTSISAEAQHDFRNAKPGDKVYSVIHGHGIISSIYLEPGIALPLGVKFNSLRENETVFYTFDGRFTQATNPTLFWPGSTLTIPYPPEKVVAYKKTFYLNLSVDPERRFLDIFDSKKEAEELDYLGWETPDHVGVPIEVSTKLPESAVAQFDELFTSIFTGV